MKSKTPVIWDRKPELKSIIEDIIVESLLAERIVSFDGEDFDIPEDEISRLKSVLRTGQEPGQNSIDAMLSYMEGEDDWEPPDRTYNVDKGIETLVKRYGLDERGEQNLNDIVSGYARSSDIGAKAIKALVNAADGFPLFTHDAAAYPGHEAVEPLLRLKHDAKSGAVGQGEILASLLYGTPGPANPGLERDVDLRGGPNAGGWHVKYTSRNTGSTPWGESKDALKAFKDTIEASAPELWPVVKNRIDSSGETSGFGSATAADVMTTAGLNPQDFDRYADVLDQAMAAMASSGEAEGVLFATPTEFIFKPASEVKYGGTMKSGRLTVAHADEPDFRKRIKKSAERASATQAKEQAAWDSIKDLPFATRYTLGRGNGLSKPEVNALLRMRNISDLDVITTDSEGTESIETKNRTAAVRSWTEEDKTAIIKALRDSDPESPQNSSYRRDGAFLYEKVNRIIALEKALNEELTRADKKDIEKMIAKRIEADRAEQKRQFKKHLAEELKSSKFQKLILEMAKDEMGRELKGKQLEGAVVEITKKVIKKLYRELSYSYNPMIDRIKL